MVKLLKHFKNLLVAIMTKLFNPLHPHNPAEDSVVVFEWIDAGVFTGDMLEHINLEEFEEYCNRWLRSIKAEQKAKRDERISNIL